MLQQRVLGSILFQSGHANLQIEEDEIFIPFDDGFHLLVIPGDDLAHSQNEFFQQALSFLTIRDFRYSPNDLRAHCSRPNGNVYRSRAERVYALRLKDVFFRPKREENK